MKKVAYLAMDVHARSCTLGHMDDDGSSNSIDSTLIV